MQADFILVFQWWGMLFLVGAAAVPLTKTLFSGWWDRGYLLAKAVGLATVCYFVYLLGTLRLLAFDNFTIAAALGIVFVAGVLLEALTNKNLKPYVLNLKSGFIFLLEEVLFFAALLFWSWIKAHEPSIHGLEKFMDYGFTRSILDTRFFPALDMWYSGGTINYYYFGHIVMAMLTKFSGLDLRFTFNLMLSSIFAFTATMSFSIGYQISQTGRLGKIKSIIAGFLTAFLVTLAGNLQTLYAFTRGYQGDKVKPFWELFWNMREIGGIGELWGKIGEGMNTYWYANATRFIPYTIHEFPSYSFVVSDVHGHVLSLPFVLLAIGLLISMATSDKRQATSQAKEFQMSGLSLTTSHLSLIFYGFLVGVLLMTNALDGPVYFGLFAVILLIYNWSNLTDVSNWKIVGATLGLAALTAGLTSLPFLLHFKSFVSGLAVNCPLPFLANTKFGPLMFEGVEKCQHSPIWMMALLWGFFIYCGGSLIVFWRHGSRHKFRATGQPEKLLIVFFLFSLALIIFPEFFYFKDIYPLHFRSNTMFKLGYQAFIMFSIVAGYTIVNLLATSDKRHETSKKIFFIFLFPMLFLVSIYPVFSVRSYFDSLRTYRGLNGTEWLAMNYFDDYQAIEWLNKQVTSDKRQAASKTKQFQKPDSSLITYHSSPTVIVEADGDSYTDYARFSAFTGLATVIGWPVHEWLWRGSYDVVAPRREEVGKIYESQDIELTKQILNKYRVKYVIIGTLEREKYKGLAERKFMKLGKIAFQSGTTIIYEIAN